MLVLHLLGHNYISEDGVPFKVSTKTLALLTYLTLQRRPQHREHLAELMWNTPDALRNLRVELNRLQHLGLKLFPARQSLLELRLQTDLDQWSKEADTLPESRLSEWLSLGSSLPLSGLEDLGSDAFRAWLDGQKWAISQQIETTLSRVYLRALQGGRVGAARLIRVHAEELGVQLNTIQVEVPAPSAVNFERQEVRQQFQRVLQLARAVPQLVLLSGLHDGGNRELVQQLVAQSDWQVIQMQAVVQSELLQATFLHQLMRVLPPDSQAAAWKLLTNPSGTGEDLIRVWTLVAASGLPLVVAIYDLHLLTPFLIDSLRFAMDLPISLTLVLSSSALVGEHVLREALGSIDHSRVHLIEVPVLAVQEVMEAVREQQALLNADQLRAYATRVVQQSDGWDLHARALIGSEFPLSSVHTTPPGIVRNTLLSELGGLSPLLRQSLARLAMVYSPLDRNVASVLLGQGAEETLVEGVRQNLLVTAAPEETILMPHLIYQTSDVEDGLGFVSEPLRVALAGTLTSLERREIRSLLAAYFVPSNPALAHHYAQRAGLEQPATSLLSQAPEQPGQATVPAASLWVKPEISAPATGMGQTSRQECRTGNGYRVALEQGQLQILRRGLYGPPPSLQLLWPSVPAGHWHLVARLDVYDGAPTWAESTRPYALGVRAGQSARLIFGAQATDDYLEQGILHAPGPPIPFGRWFVLEGLGDQGILEVSVRMVDIALTIAELRWGPCTLLPVKKSMAVLSDHYN
ncbi:hypothetical protein Q0M94_18190 (plasmid) [Deinococcus radiomollis]|uniref:hypothetical protein n=1 Tax=Deinococcus radiomollis TaxID=468916 RepID=UPI00389209A0